LMVGADGHLAPTFACTRLDIRSGLLYRFSLQYHVR
jgi:hypothetical protein